MLIKAFENEPDTNVYAVIIYILRKLESPIITHNIIYNIIICPRVLDAGHDAVKCKLNRHLI